jgi:hypothetical protein
MKSRPIKKISKEEIFKGALNSAEVEGIFFKDQDKVKLWEAFKNGGTTIL